MGGLGCKAYLSMSRGDQVQDYITVAIIVETLRWLGLVRERTLDHWSSLSHRNLPQDCSWVLDNFPTTLEQAKVCVWLVM